MHYLSAIWSAKMTLKDVPTLCIKLEIMPFQLIKVRWKGITFVWKLHLSEVDIWNVTKLQSFPLRLRPDFFPLDARFTSY